MQTGFEVYRDEVKIADTVESYYSDANFADGVNEYYVKTKFFEETSIASDRDTAIIYANPAPGYLTGYESSPGEVQLDWYAPMTDPPGWYGFIDVLDATFDGVDGMTGTWAKRRTLYTATDLGMTYPITVDSLAAAFYEANLGDWTNSHFTFTVYTAATDGSDSILYVTGNLTAVSDQWTTNASLTQTMNQGWYVELGVYDDGTPTSLVSTHPGVSGNSSAYYSGDETYGPGWYNITYGEDQGDWAILCYGEGSEQTWYYNKEEAPVEKLVMTAYNAIPAVKEEITANISNPKSLTQYNIYRNGSIIGNTTLKTFTDVNAPNQTTTYYVTALYSDPVGESDPSNEFVFYPPPGPEPFYTSVELEIIGSTLMITWEALSTATGYDVYSSSNPYGTFTFVGSTENLYLEIPISEDKRFYYVVGTYDKKEPLEEIKVKLPSNDK